MTTKRTYAMKEHVDPYQKISRSLVKHELLRSGLSDLAKLLIFYLLVMDGNRIGCFMVSLKELEFYLGRSQDDLYQALLDLENADFLFYADQWDWVCIRNYLKWNPPTTPKQARVALNDFRSIPVDSGIYRQALHEVHRQIAFLPETAEALAKEVQERFERDGKALALHAPEEPAE